MTEPVMLDTFGVPEFFSTDVGAIEDAGDGMIRLIRCVKRNGVLIPVFSFVTPALAMLAIGPTIRAVAMQIARGKGAGADH
jgi:hypothetical protein